jgi:hypothetical protein
MILYPTVLRCTSMAQRHVEAQALRLKACACPPHCTMCWAHALRLVLRPKVGCAMQCPALRAWSDVMCCAMLRAFALLGVRTRTRAAPGPRLPCAVRTVSNASNLLSVTLCWVTVRTLSCTGLDTLRCAWQLCCTSEL